jgi:hypothetical protein
MPYDKERFNRWDFLIVIGCIMVMVWIGREKIDSPYTWCDESGWISHRAETMISVPRDWLIGESKECQSATLDSDAATYLNREIGYAFSSVDCGGSGGGGHALGGELHQMRAKFYGRKVQPEYKAVMWRCVRRQPSGESDSSFTCYETGGLAHFVNRP